VNAFIRMILRLDSGNGPIKKSDFRRELKSGQHRPEIYTRDELKILFEVMTSEEYYEHSEVIQSPVEHAVAQVRCRIPATCFYNTVPVVLLTDQRFARH
jgi:hypothetical protein